MVDQTKRTTLKILSGSAAVMAASSSVVMAGNCIYGADKSHTAMEETVVPVSNGTELTIALSVEPEPTIRMTNHSNKLLIVRHVYPGIVHAGDQTFDINSIFENSAYAIGAGTTRNVLIKPTASTTAETSYPGHLYKKQPQRIAAVTGRDHQGKLANSTRSFFA